MTQFTFMPDWRWLVGTGALTAVILAVSYYRARGRAAAPWRALLFTLRCLAIALLVVCLLDPQWVEKIPHQPTARLAVLLDTSRSMATQDVPGGRLARAQAWVQKQILQGKPAALDVSAFSFSQGITPLPNLNAASPTGAVTALASALESLLTVPAENPLTGIVLLSDGIETSPQSPEAVARQFRRKGIPIHTVTLGTTNEMKDVVIENVHVKRAVPNEAPTRVDVSLRSAGFPNQSVSVQIRKDQSVLATRSVRLNGANQQVEIEFTPKQKGFQVYEVSVTPLKDEWLVSNNHRQFGLEVTDPTLRVLYMEGTPQQNGSPMPEWKYLKDALQSDPQIKVTVLYRQKGNNGQFLNTVDSDPETNEKIYPVEHPTKGYPRTLAALLEYDVIIHSDIKLASFNDEQLQNTAKLVEQHGGGFVMIGGNSAFGKGGYHKTVLDRIIPVAMQSSDDSEVRPITLHVPRAAWNHPLISFSGDRADTEAIWTKKFPTLYGMNRVERAKPGATVLARDDSDDGNVLIAVQQIGKGRSMAFTSDTTRSWGRDFETIWGEPNQANGGLSEFNCDSRYYRKFWVNAVRWLAAGKYGHTNSPVTLELARGYGAPGDPVTASIKVRNEQQQDVATADVSLYLTRNGTSNVVAKATYDNTTRSYVAEWPAPAAGSYFVSAVATQRGVRLGDDRQLFVSEVTDREMADLRARPDLMSAIARASGGQAYDGSAPVDSPAALFAQLPPPTIEFHRTPLWDKPAWLAAILGLISLEWTLRRWRGLA